MAALGQRNMDDGLEKVEDDPERRQLRRQALGIMVKAGVVGAAATVVVGLLP